jgi:hypothetical protein
MHGSPGICEIGIRPDERSDQDHDLGEVDEPGGECGCGCCGGEWPSAGSEGVFLGSHSQCPSGC